MATEAKGFFDANTVTAYLTDFVKNLDSRNLLPDIEYWYNPDELCNINGYTTKVCVDGRAKMAPPDIAQILCLDVGCWTGDGPKNAKNHPRHREFGVVCGNMAVLCAFSQNGYEGITYDKNIDKKIKKEPIYINKIKPLLDHLSSDTNRTHGLGDVEVISAMTAHDTRCPNLDTKNIHVFLGDLHLPVISDEADTYIKPKGAELGRDEVLSCGRLSLNDNVKSIVYYMGLQAGLTLSTPPSLATVFAGYSLSALGKQLGAMESIDVPNSIQNDGIMQRKEAREWYGYYYGSRVQKGADIFQDAGDDLVKFLKLLRDRPHSLGNIDLTQLGDCYDFWIGMKCGFSERVSYNPGANFFVDFWRNRTKKNRKVGKTVSLLESLQNHPRLPTRILYGNHDNYLMKTRAARYYDKGGNTFWAEHGHQSDSFNCDDDAVNGWALTQTAFLFPAIREIEDPASAALCAIQRFSTADAYPARLQRLARGVDVCIEERKLIYVMAHTHRPCLRKIYVKLAWDRAAANQHWYSDTLRYSQHVHDHLENMGKLSSQIGKELASDAAEAVAKEARKRLLQAALALIRAERALQQAKKKAEAKLIETALEAKWRALREFVNLVIVAAKAEIILSKASNTVRLAVQAALEKLGQIIVQKVEDDIATARMIIEIALKAAEIALLAYQRVIQFHIEIAEAAGRAAYKELKKASKWLKNLPGNIRKDFESKADKIYRF
ncbi:MAG: hypothetical protein JW841_07415 [Deltaproteobacteria bacterium]|nr:hypothetical protein [Deltaproteobacteria bacterium]